MQIDDFNQAENYAADYLRTYYSGDVTPDDRALLAFLVRELPRLAAIGRPEMLEVGCGPVVHHMLPAVPYVSAIDMCDFREDNIREVDRWRDNEPAAHDWRRWTRLVLELEQHGIGEEASVHREAALRSLIRSTTLCDLRRDYPLAPPRRYYPAVACFYTTEQASSNREQWRDVFRNLCGLVAPGGHLFACSVADTDHYIVYDHQHRSVCYSIPRLFPDDYRQALLDNDFLAGESVVEYQPLAGQEAEGVFGVILVAARKAQG
jgi:hypothetical protein